MIDADEALIIVRGLRQEIKKLTVEKQLMALQAAQLGCPKEKDPECGMTALPPSQRNTLYCAQCWQKRSAKCGLHNDDRKEIPGMESA